MCPPPLAGIAGRRALQRSKLDGCLLKVRGLGFRGLGFRSLGFRGLGFRGLGFRWV